jgi:hypothetical protein
MVTQSTLVAPHTEKQAAASRALTTSVAEFSIVWLSGAVDIALELQAQSDPSVIALVLDDLLGQYAIASETSHVGRAEAAAAAHGAGLDTSSYGALIADIIEVGTTIQEETGKFGDQLAVTKTDWIAILGLLDGDGRRVLATQGGTNADGSAGLTAQTVNIGGVDVFYSPRSTASMQFNDVALLVGEQAPMTVDALNVELMGRDLGVLGGILSVERVAAGIVKYAA